MCVSVETRDQRWMSSYSIVLSWNLEVTDSAGLAGQGLISPELGLQTCSMHSVFMRLLREDPN